MAVPVTHVESVSPELVLIDPRLAIDARARLSAPDDTLARLEPDLATSIAEKKAAALRRITELSDVDELATRRRSYRVPKLSMAIATWSTAAILVADVQLYDWTTWLV
jgi:hypothetical protein